ncbi:MAG: geranylgeranyl pyrophosphate synthase [Acidimicrobiales bacterium]|nr:MAG: geranylgeranyl pyrophosphate synthase [Acidimicrobiales bacterium]
MTDAPAQLTRVATLVDRALAEVFAEERACWQELDPALDTPLGDLEDFVAGGGKRIRPGYCHWGWVTAGGDPDGDGAVMGSCALELLHAFALVHDDVMDGSPTRRGSPTVWARFIRRHETGGWAGEDRRFGEAAAILVGDIAMVMADRCIGNAAPEVRAVWDALRTELNMGQYLDVLGTVTGEVSADGARTIMRNKTAGYTIVRPLQLGAALAGRSDLADDLAAHGMPLGIAFQLRDDMLGAFGDSERTGKPVGDDLTEGKPTVLLALARERADATQLAILDTVGGHMRADDIAAVQQVMVDTGAVAASEAETEQLLETALLAIDALPDHHGSRDALRALADYVVERDT